MHAITHNPLTLLILQITIVVTLSRVLGILLRQIRQPMVIAEVTAGIVLGPSLLGWLAPSVMETVFPKTSMPMLGLISQVGLVLFMFLIGLELDPKLLKNRGKASIAISHTSIVLPFALGALAAFWLRNYLAEPHVPFSSFVLFMGIAMSITAFPVLARILTERRLLRTKVGAIAITCAAVDDVTAWCLLAFVVSAVRATGIDSAVRTTLMAIAYIVVMMLVVRPFLARVGEKVGSRQPVNQNIVALALLLLLISSMVTEVIGIHALFGAFILGAAIPKEGGLAEALAHKLEDLVVVLLLPPFFAYSGLRTQIGLLNSPLHWGLCALLIALACLGKFGGSAIAARLTGHGWREASAIGILMNTRGLMELVVLNIGLDLGVISPTLFTMLVLMALFTTFITTPLLQIVYPFERFASEAASIPDATPMPVDRKPAFTLVMCVADARTGPGMVALGRALIAPDSSERLYALHLIKPDNRASFVLQQERTATDDDNALDPLLERAESLSLPVKPLTFVSGEPATDICRVAETKHADLLLLGWRKPLIGQAALSGTVYEVMKRAPADIGVFVDRGLSQIRRVLVPFIGGAHDRAALRLAQRITHLIGADVTVLHVTAPERDQGKPLGAKARMEEVFREPGAAGQVTFEVVEHNVPSEAALAEAARGYDLVIVGAGAEWGLEERLFGLHPEHMIRACPISLLVVRQHNEAREPARNPSLIAVPAGE